SCGLVLCSCFFAVCFADESTRTKPRNHTNQESRKDTKGQLMSQLYYYRMKHYLIVVLLTSAALLSYGCANPAANKPKAAVGNAAPESNTAKPAGGETLAITPVNSKVEFVAAKVTRSHNGSFKQFGGTIDLLNNDPQQSIVSIAIDTSSV